MATHTEIEAKVRWKQDSALPPLGLGSAALQSEAGEPVDLEARYYDTVDLRLLRWGVTLRRRSGGDDAGWHLKIPEASDGVLTRDEVRLPLWSGSDGANGEVPAEFVRAVQSLVREAPLEHVATVVTHRTPYALRDTGGRSLAHLADDLVRTEVAGSEGPSFREIEVEAEEGLDAESASRVVGKVVKTLVDSGGEKVERTTLSEALGPRSGGFPDVVVPDVPKPEDPVGDVVRWVLASCASRLLLQEVRIQRHQPDSVHQVRVAARKFRSALRTFRPVLDRDWAQALDARLDEAAEAWRVPRDTEVQLARLSKAATRLDAGDRDAVIPVLDRALQQRLTESTAAAERHLSGAEHVRLLADVVQAARAPRLGDEAQRPASEALPELLDRTNRRLLRSIQDLSQASAPEDWHKARIKAKRARYLASAAASVLGGEVEDLALALAGVTDLLGRHQDRQVARQTLRSISRRDDVSPAAAYSLGLLEADQMTRAGSDRARFLRRRKKLKRQLRT